MLFGWKSAWRKRRDKRAVEAARKARGRGFRSPHFEALEDRQMLSVTFDPLLLIVTASLVAV